MSTLPTRTMPEQDETGLDGSGSSMPPMGRFQDAMNAMGQSTAPTMMGPQPPMAQGPGQDMGTLPGQPTAQDMSSLYGGGAGAGMGMGGGMGMSGGMGPGMGAGPGAGMGMGSPLVRRRATPTPGVGGAMGGQPQDADLMTLLQQFRPRG